MIYYEIAIISGWLAACLVWLWGAGALVGVGLGIYDAFFT